MNADTRNAKVVVTLISAMTLGATALLWMEPQSVRWSGPALLMAGESGPIESVLIDYVGPDQAIDGQRYDCIVFADRAPLWQPTQTRVRLAVVGSDADHLPAMLAEQLLAVLSSLQGSGLDLSRVVLSPDSDPRLHPELSTQAHELAALLLRKGVIH